jgi:hypothetical protein
METKKIYELHREHTDWISKLDFYRDEVQIFQERLEEVATKNNRHEVLALVEHFQNQLFIQLEKADELHDEIEKHEIILGAKIDRNPVAPDRREATDHAEQREKIRRYEQIFHNLRDELMGFLAKHL